MANLSKHSMKSNQLCLPAKLTFKMHWVSFTIGMGKLSWGWGEVEGGQVVQKLATFVAQFLVSSNRIKLNAIE